MGFERTENAAGFLDVEEQEEELSVEVAVSWRLSLLVQASEC